MDGSDGAPARRAEQAREAALRLLSSQARTRAELVRALARKGYEQGVIEEVLTRLSSAGLVDDEAFAKAWVESRSRARARGRRALRSELARKGIDADIVGEALSDLDSDVEHHAAVDLVTRRARAMSGLDRTVRRRRLLGLLARRGYGETAARRAVGEALEDT